VTIDPIKSQEVLHIICTNSVPVPTSIANQANSSIWRLSNCQTKSVEALGIEDKFTQEVPVTVKSPSTPVANTGGHPPFPFTLKNQCFFLGMFAPYDKFSTPEQNV
jgi:hypothetical protein